MTAGTLAYMKAWIMADEVVPEFEDWEEEMDDQAAEVFVDDTPVGNTERVYTSEPVPKRA